MSLNFIVNYLLNTNCEQTYAPKDTQRFKFGFEFSIFWVFEFWVWEFGKSLANFEKDNFKLKKIILFFDYVFGYQF